jgi:hypothetical protein
MGAAENATPRPDPGTLDLAYSYLWLGEKYGTEYSFRMYRTDSSDNLYFVDPRQDPQPPELQEGKLDLGLDKVRMTELRDHLTYLLDNWGGAETRESHPEEEK